MPACGTSAPLVSWKRSVELWLGVETNLTGLVRKVGERPLPRNDVTPFVEGLYLSVCRAVALAVQAVRDDDQRAAAEVLSLDATVRQQTQLLAEAEAARLEGQDEDFLRLTRLRMAAAGDLQRIYDLARRIAKAVLPAGYSGHEREE